MANDEDILMKTYKVLVMTTKIPTVLDFSTLEDARQWINKTISGKAWSIFDDEGQLIEYSKKYSMNVKKMADFIEQIGDIKAAEQAISKLEKGEDKVIDAKEMWHKLQGMGNDD